MSLVNEMLTDLQARRAADSEPLSGLQAVRDGGTEAGPGRSKAWLLVAGLLLGVSVILLSQVQTADESGAIAAALPVADVLPPAPRGEPPAAMPGPPENVKQVAAQPVISVEAVARTNEPVAMSAPAAIAPRSAVARAGVKPAPDARVAKPPPRHDAAPAETGDNGIGKTAVPLPQRLRRDGLTALRAGRPVAAARYFEQLIAVETQQTEPHLLLHAALRAQARPDAAHAVLVSALDAVTDATAIARVVGHELLAGERIDRAVAVLERHRPADRSDLEYESLLAAAHQRAGNHRAAAAVYEGLVLRRPANGVWWVGLAISQEAAGQLDAARHSFASARLAGTLDDALEAYARERLEKLGTGT